MTKPTFDEENDLWQQGYDYIAGVDEVGRGCFAGPVVAAAVILPKYFTKTEGINDSKLLTPRKRNMLSVLIKSHAVAFAISEIAVNTINKIGIAKATQKAFYQSIKLLKINPDYILIDAFYIKSLAKKNQKSIIHGDRKSISIAAASIIAKVYRDNRMLEFDKQYSKYSFVANKGYGTKQHQEAIRKYGLSNLHRKSFDLQRFLLNTNEAS